MEKMVKCSERACDRLVLVNAADGVTEKGNVRKGMSK